MRAPATASRRLETVDRLKSERAFNQFREYHAGLIADVIGNPPEAEQAVPQAAYEGERTTLQVVDAYARFLAKRGSRKDEAIAVYTEFDKALPRHPMVRAALDDARSAASRCRRPIANAQEGAAEVLYGLGVVGNSQGDELTAIIYLRLALHLDPEHRLALVTPRRHLRAAEAIRPRQRDLRARSRRTRRCAPSADIAIGQNLELLQPQRRGRRAISRALMKERPDDVEVIMALGNVLRSRKRFAEAAEVYTQGRRADRHAGPRPLDPVLLPRHLLRARQAVGEGRGGPQEGAGTRARRRSRPAGRRS